MRRLDERGETLVEVVMALGILSLVLVSSYTLATGTFRLGRGAGERTQAVNYLQQQIEALRTYRNQVSWDPVFSDSMQAYSGTDKSFCMKQTEVLSRKVWRPTETDCTFDGIAISIVPTTVASNEQYNYELKGTWKTGSQENNVSLTTKLVNQD